MAQRPEQWAVHVSAVSGSLYIGTQPRGGLRVDRQGVASSALADDAKRVKAPVLVPVAVGLKVTLRVQLAPAVTLEPQVLVWEKSPLAAMLVMLSAALPVFLSVTF